MVVILEENGDVEVEVVAGEGDESSELSPETADEQKRVNSFILLNLN